MKVRVQYTIVARPGYRRAINMHYGKPGLATRDEVRDWLETYGSSEDDNLMWELQKAVEAGEESELLL